MKKVFSSLLVIMVASVSQGASKQLYVKDGAGFKLVSKREATIALLGNKAPVFACVEQRLSDKMTIKAKNSDD